MAEKKKTFEELQAELEALKEENERLKEENSLHVASDEKKKSRSAKLKGLGTMVDINAVYRKKKYGDDIIPKRKK